MLPIFRDKPIGDSTDLRRIHGYVVRRHYKAQERQCENVKFTLLIFYKQLVLQQM